MSSSVTSPKVLLLFLLLPFCTAYLDESTRLLITSKVEALPIASFQDDVILKQELSESTVSYHLPWSDVTLFSQNSTEDAHSQVTILQSGEDRLMKRGKKNVYVVLKKLPQTAKKLYWVFFAYIREDSEGESVEWDTWEDRSHAFHSNKANLFGWTSCGSSFIVPCKFHAPTAPPEFKERLPSNLMDFKSSQNYLESSSSSSSSDSPILGTNFQLLEFFSDVPPLERDSASFVSLAVEAMVFSRSSYGRLLPQYNSLRPKNQISSSYSQNIPPLCKETNSLEDPFELCEFVLQSSNTPPPRSETEAPPLSNIFSSPRALLQSKMHLDMKVNELAFLGLGSSLLEGLNHSTLNLIGQSLLRDLLNLPSSASNPAHRSTTSKDATHHISLPESELHSSRHSRDAKETTANPNAAEELANPMEKFHQRTKGEAKHVKLGTFPRVLESLSLLRTDVDLFSDLGWSTGISGIEELSNRIHEHADAFVGIGGCGFSNFQGLEDLEKLEDPREIGEFYLSALGTDCMQVSMQGVIDLIEGGHIKVTERKTFTAVSPNRNWLKLSREEMETLSKAVELSAFSQTFHSSLSSPKGNYPHPNFHFIKTFALEYLTLTYEHFPLHSVKLKRNLLRTLQSVFTKSLQDFYKIKYCDNCPHGDDGSSLDAAAEEPMNLLSLISFVASEETKGTSVLHLQFQYAQWAAAHVEHSSDMFFRFFNFN